jgi:hypothetical protein
MTLPNDQSIVTAQGLACEALEYLNEAEDKLVEISDADEEFETDIEIAIFAVKDALKATGRALTAIESKLHDDAAENEAEDEDESEAA